MLNIIIKLFFYLGYPLLGETYKSYKKRLDGYGNYIQIVYYTIKNTIYIKMYNTLLI